MKNIKQNLVHRLFETLAAAKPDRNAIIFNNRQISYNELNEQASVICRHLWDLGVGPGAFIGICCRRSIDMAAGILGILQSGAAYVPMDPRLPGERLAFICRDAGLSIIITQPDIAPSLCFPGIRLVSLPVNFPSQPGGAVPCSLPFPRSSCPARPAYIMYTSGSTGKPKGVVISHDSLCGFVRALQQVMELTADDVYLHTASFGYALSVRQFWTPLCSGAALVLATEEQIAAPLRLFQEIKQTGATIMDMVPSYWRVCLNILLQQKKNSRMTLLDNRLRLITSVGEALSADLPAAWNIKLGHPAAIINIFGQTETTGAVSFYPVTGGDVPGWDKGGGLIPIGSPLPRTRLLVLDDDLRQVAPGETGELFVDNPSLASGYLNRPELTAAKFIPYRDAHNRSKYIYKTGDRIRLLEDGTLQHAGRSDNQVKLNGIRVELEEIETLLNRHPAVQEAAVALERQENLAGRLVAFVVPVNAPGVSSMQLRRYLRKKLPRQSIPARFDRLDKIPRTLSGKIDRLYLQRIISAREKIIENKNRDMIENPPGKPVDETEKKLCRLWAQHLGIGEVGVGDDFFELGGSSLQAIALFDSIGSTFNRMLPVTVLLQAPTVRQLARLIEDNRANSSFPSIVSLRNGHNGKIPIFFVHGIGGTAVFYRDLVNSIGMDLDCYGIQVPIYEDDFKQFGSLEEMAGFHAAQLREMLPGGPYLLAGYSSGGVVAYEMARQLKEQGADVRFLALLETHLPNNRRLQRKKWNAGLVMSFIKNIPLWFFDFLGDTENKERLKRRVLRLKGNLEYLWHDIKSDKKQQLLLGQVKVVRAYEPKPYDGKVMLFRARVQGLFEPRPRDYGWGRYVNGGIDVQTIPGSHRALLKAAYAREIAGILTRSLEKVLSDFSPQNFI